MMEKLNQFINRNPYCLVQVSAEWCKNCIPMERLVGSMTKEKNIPILKLEAGEEIRGIVNKFYVSSVPTFLIFRDGILENRIVGTRSQVKIKQILG